MRDYSAVCPQFWTGRTGRQIRKLGPMAQVVALYLLTAPGSTMLGLYYLPIGTIVHETGIPEGDVHEIMADFDEMGFAYYDADNEVVWVVEMARFQIAETVVEKDKRHAYIVRESPKFAASPLYDRWYDHYHVAFTLPARKEVKRDCGGQGGGHREAARGIKGASDGQDAPHMPSQDLSKARHEQLNPRERERAPAREAQAPERVESSQDEPAKSAERPAYIALIATIADAADGKFDGLGVGSVLQQAFGATLQNLSAEDATLRRMGEMAHHPERIWPTAKGLTKGFVSLGWVMGKRDEHGTYNAPWVLAWVTAARESLAAEAQRAARVAAPPVPAAPRNIVADEDKAGIIAKIRAEANARKNASPDGNGVTL